MSFWETFWATFAGGIAAALVSIVGIIIVEFVRARVERGREERSRQDQRIIRRRASRNAAVAIRMEIHGIVRPVVRFCSGLSGWEPMTYTDDAWSDLNTRLALVDGLTDDALLDVAHAYRELRAMTERIAGEGNPFLEELARDGGQLGKRILELHVDPAMSHLTEAIAVLETLELAERGQLDAEAKRIRSKKDSGVLTQ